MPVQRLKSRDQFQAVMAAGTVSRTPHFALHRAGLDAVSADCAAAASVLRLAPGVWIGALVPKRWAKRAVTRNTIRRQIFALVSDARTRLLPAAHVVRLRTGFDRREFVSASSQRLKQAVRGELQQLFDKASSNGRGA